MNLLHCTSRKSWFAEIAAETKDLLNCLSPFREILYSTLAHILVQFVSPMF